MNYQSEFLPQSAVVRLVTIAEEFTVGRLEDAGRRKIGEDDAFSDGLWKPQFDQAEKNWPGRISLWKLLDVDVSRGFGSFPALTGFVDARNAVSHALGAMTSKQAMDSGIKGRLKAAGVRLVGTRLILEREDVERCASITYEYIHWLDESAGEKSL
jgi:hypothetical protein